MKVCDACLTLDGQVFTTPPHKDLALMSSHSATLSGFQPMMKSWRCLLCDTWLRQHAGYGDYPGVWEALIQINPWYENGYQVFGEARKCEGSSAVEAWYQIEVPEAKGRPRSVAFTSVRLSAFKTAFAATYAALRAGRRHARLLRSCADAPTPQLLYRSSTSTCGTRGVTGRH